MASALLTAIILGLAAVGAAFYILRTPQLRRTVWRAAKNAAALAGPALVTEAKRVWTESDREPERLVGRSPHAI